MYYLVYKTTNLLNDRFYIGSHSTHKIQDGYLGSGLLIKEAINKYGKDSFIREVLFVFDNPKDMYEKERELVDHTNPQSYNLVEGGQGGWQWDDDRKQKQSTRLSGDKNPMFGVRRFDTAAPHHGRKHSPEAIAKMRAAKLGNSNKKGKKLSEESRKRISLARQLSSAKP